MIKDVPSLSPSMATGILVEWFTDYLRSLFNFVLIMTQSSAFNSWNCLKYVIVCKGYAEYILHLNQGISPGGTYVITCT